jgi:aminopeptidase N
LRRRLLPLALLLQLLVPAVAWAEARLPGDVMPSEVQVTIDPDIAALTFRGHVALRVQALRNVDRIVLNAAELEIEHAAIDGVPARVKLNEKAETLTLATGKPLARGPHRIEIAYRGTIKKQPLGLFAVDDPTKAGARRMLATQFEASDARRMLPCFDEPAMKARFHVTVIAPGDQRAISNMEETRRTKLADGRLRFDFAPSPLMSSYLLFLAVGQFDTISQRVDGRLLRVVAAEGEAAKGRFALDLATKLLPFYERYFARPYPLPKLDLFAVPASGGFGAMENWGALLFFERWLLFDPARNGAMRRQEVAVTVAHEMAHQWFGNLVTMRWWDDLWLNEGFASWMENHAVDALQPSWQIWLQTRRERESAMRQDARRSSHPVVQNVDSANEANAAFDDITYRKGQSLVRMLDGWLGADPFRAAMRSWMRTYAYGNATTADLWAMLERESGQPVRQVMASFTTQPGLPLVEASASCVRGRTHLTLAQSRFTAGHAEAPSLRWMVPLALQPLGGTPVRTVLRDAQGEIELPGCAPVIVNQGGTSWARVAYAPALRSGLVQHFADLAPADQVTLLDDSWALAETGKLDVDAYLELVAALKPDASFAVWQQVSETLLEIDGWLRGTPERAALRDFAQARLAPALLRLGWVPKRDEKMTDALLRETLIDALSSFDHRPTIEEAKRLFHRWAEEGDALPAAIRGAVLRATGRGADAREFDLLLAKARAAEDHDERQVLLSALAGVRDAGLAQRALDLSLADWVSPTTRPVIVTQVAQAGEHAALAWHFAQENYEFLTEPLDASGRWDFAASIVAGSSDVARADELRDFTEGRIPADARQPVRRAVEEIRFRADKKARLASRVARWIASHP